MLENTDVKHNTALGLALQQRGFARLNKSSLTPEPRGEPRIEVYCNYWVEHQANRHSTFVSCVPGMRSSMISTALLLSSACADIWPIPKQISTTGAHPVCFSRCGILHDASGLYAGSLLSAAVHRFGAMFVSKAQCPRQVALPLTVTTRLSTDSESLTAHTNESYSLRITHRGASIDADNPFGALHALTTLAQAVWVPNVSHVCLPQIAVHDAPDFPYRGLGVSP